MPDLATTKDGRGSASSAPASHGVYPSLQGRGGSPRRCSSASGSAPPASAEKGAAISLCKLPGLPGLVAAFARREGLEWTSAAIDGKPTYLFFVLFAPVNSAGTWHL